MGAHEKPDSRIVLTRPMSLEDAMRLVSRYDPPEKAAKRKGSPAEASCSTTSPAPNLHQQSAKALGVGQSPHVEAVLKLVQIAPQVGGIDVLIHAVQAAL